MNEDCLTFFLKKPMKVKSVTVLAICLFIFYVAIIRRSKKSMKIQLNTPNIQDNSIKYKEACVHLYKKLRFPNKSLLFNPAIMQPPADMLEEFTQYGKMPIKKWWYINEIYNDSFSNYINYKRTINATEIEELREKVKRNDPLNYQDQELNMLMQRYKSELKQKSLAVIGTQIPWIEAIGLEIGCSKIFTLDYTHAHYDYAGMKWYHVNDFLDKVIEKETIEEFDNIASFSSLEHSGLGRYGDPLNPNGDIEAVRQVHCLLKPGGLFFLALPTHSDGSNHIEFNAHRIYGKARLDILFQGWSNLLQISDTAQTHTIFMLKKSSKNLSFSNFFE